jgi:hypothetical protein
MLDLLSRGFSDASPFAVDIVIESADDPWYREGGSWGLLWGAR